MVGVDVEGAVGAVVASKTAIGVSPSQTYSRNYGDTPVFTEYSSARMEARS